MDNLPTDGLLAPGLACLCLALITYWPGDPSPDLTNHKVISRAEIQLSPMGRVAQKFVTDPVVLSGHMEGPPVNKGETSLAMDGSGAHIVVGFNDPRGFLQSPISTSGYMVSDDGGATFLDCGRLQAPEGASLFAHPQVRYIGGSNFIYTCLVVKPISEEATSQTICLYRSSDNGHSWDGPYEVTPATASADGPVTAADKEFVDVDQETGRVLISWTEFVADGDEKPTKICTTYSDNVLTASTPTWADKVVLDENGKTTDSGAMPKFGRGGVAYLAWSETAPGTRMRNIAFSQSKDDGATWSTPAELRSSYFMGMDQIIGCETTNDFPAITVDTSLGLHSGTIYVVYTDNSSRDGADVMLQESTNGGKSFTQPISLSPTPGHDGAQWFPSISVDSNTGKVHVFYFDQSSAKTGDLTDAMVLASEDGGESWTAPSPLTDKPFHAATGANAGEPNLGEYNEILTVGDEALTMVPVRPVIPEFNEMEERNRSALVDFAFRRVKDNAIPLRLEGVQANGASSQSKLQPGDTANLFLNLKHFATNLRMSPRVVSHIHARVSTNTPGITVTHAQTDFSDVVAGANSTNQDPLQFEIATDFNIHTPIEFEVELQSTEGSTSIPVTLRVGEVDKEKIFSESFSGKADGGLPAGWVDKSQPGATPSAWSCSKATASCLYHPVLVGDLSNARGSIFESVTSPAFKVSPQAEAISVDFDIAYNTDSDVNLAKLVYSGCTLRVIEQTDDEAESRLANSIATEFTMEAKGEQRNGYPCHLPESSNPAYFQNVDVWGGVSRGVEHVHFQIPSVGGKKVRLRWDYTEDPQLKGHIDTKSGLAPGVMISNLVVYSETRSAKLNSALVAKAETFTLNEGSYIRNTFRKVLHVAEASCATTTFSVDKNPAHGKLYLHSDGLFMYQPNLGFNGQDHFSYTLTDAASHATTALVYLNVEPIIKAIFVPSQIKADSIVNGSVTLTGSAPPDGLSVVLSSNDSTFLSVPVAVKIAAQAKSATFEIHSGMSPVAVHSYISGTLNGLSNRTELLLLPQIYPSAGDHNFIVYQGDKLEGGAGCLFSGAKTLTKTPFSTERTASASHGQAVILPNGAFSYMPSAGFAGIDNFSYRINQAGKVSESATVEVQVMPTLRQVELQKDEILSGSRSSILIVLTNIVPGTGETVNLRSGDPEHLKLPATVLIPGGVSRYNVDFETTDLTSEEHIPIVVSVHGASASAMLSLVPHKELIAKSFFFRVNQDETLTKSSPGVLAGASDPNPGADEDTRRPTAETYSQPKHGAVSLEGTGGFRYTPAVAYVGPDSFTFQVKHGQSLSGVQIVQIWVEPTLSELKVDSSPDERGETFGAMVTLGGMAKEDGMRVSLESTRPDLIEVPTAVVVEKGGNMAKFKMTAHAVTTPTTVYLKATLNGVEKDVMVILRP
ncbi:MAG TPA: tandem-95 repeat protein [Fimbriimonadaceae bacterium]